MRYVLLLFTIFISLFSNAQELEKSLLWKISGNGLNKPSYLFGTIHLTCDTSLDANTLNALETTEQLYLELDMDDKSIQMQMMKLMMMKNGTKLSTLLSPEDFKILDDFMKKNLKNNNISLDIVNIIEFLKKNNKIKILDYMNTL